MYIYQADVWCDECGEEICNRLLPKMPKNFNPEDQCSYDSDEYPKSVPDGEETDCPENCSWCGKPLEYSLTTSGVDYVLEALIDDLITGLPTLPVSEDTLRYYSGCPMYKIAEDWAEHLSSYCLDSKDEAIVSAYLQLCKYKDKELGWPDKFAAKEK